MSHLRGLAAGALALTTVIALGACTENDNGNNTLSNRTLEPSAVGAPQSTGPAPTGGQTAGGKIPLEAKDNVFAPTTIEAKAGDVVIEMKNTGALPHTFTNTDLKVDVNANGGQTADVELKGLKAGTYKFICKYHETIGMVGELKVT
jgi:plastocyanin